MDIEELPPFDVASEQNTEGLLKAFHGSPGVSAFLRDDEIHIPIFASVVHCAYFDLRYTFDLDGVVVMLSSLSGIRAGVNYLSVGKVDPSRISNHWHILKKHIDLQNYTTNGIKAIQKSMGMVLALVDGGYFLNLTCVPKNPDHAHPMFKSENEVKVHVIGTLNAILHDFSNRLQMLSPQDLRRPSIMKSNLRHLTRMNILHRDQKFVLDLMDQALASVSNDQRVYVMVTLSKFGQKDDREFDLGTLVDTEAVINVSYHAACNVSPIDPSLDLFWSRCGLQELVGTRGRLFSVYSMTEAANYQSNLDGHRMDLGQDLMGVFREHCRKINFVQLYATTPHCHDSFVVKHPVSRVITLCDLHIQRHRAMLAGQAESYIAHVQDLARKTVCRVGLRLEAVILVKPDFPRVFEPDYFFNLSRIDYIFDTFPMIVPFKPKADGSGLRSVANAVSLYLSETVSDMYRAKNGMGGFFSSWKAFQLELALEMFFYGQLTGKYSQQYAAALGVCPLSRNSATRMRGFLGLADVSSASVGERPPPLDTWIHDDVQKARVERIFDLSDHMKASHVVVGERLSKILLCDLYQRNDRLPIDSLVGPQRPTGNLVGHRTVEDLSRELCERKGFGYPHTFGRALEITIANGLDPFPCLQSALAKLKYFPLVRYWDEKRRCRARWNFREYVELHGPNEVPSTEALAASYTRDVCAQLEKLDLAYFRTIRKYKENGMPWMKRCIECLPKTLPKDRMVTELVFLSCIGMIMNGDYVAFQKLREVIVDLPVSQKRLQELCILSSLLLVRSPLVWRFHESLPYKLVVPAAPQAAAAAARKRHASSESLDAALVDAIAEEPEEQLVTRLDSATVPASSHSRWSSLEVAYIDLTRTLSHARAYEVYLKHCRETDTPVRTFEAFKRKRRRMLAEV